MDRKNDVLHQTPQKSRGIPELRQQRFTVEVWRKHVYTVRADTPKEAIQRCKAGGWSHQTDTDIADVKVRDQSDRTVFLDDPAEEFYIWLTNNVSNHPALETVLMKFNELLERERVW